MSAAETASDATTEFRVLVLAPVGRDAQLAQQVLGRAGFSSRSCASLAELRAEIAAGAGVALLTEEALSREADASDPDRWLGAEPTWSQLPLIVLTAVERSRRRLAALRCLEQRSNATFIQRPVPRVTLVSALRAALESRRRQYAARDLLEELETAVRQRDDFLALLGHELRNPLGAIATAGDLLQEEVAAHETARFAADLIERQSRHLSRILDDLLDVSRITRGKLELRRAPVELAPLVQEVVRSIDAQIREKHQKLELRLPEEAIWVDADATRVEQILWNLLGNANKYTPAGGHLSVSLRARGDEAQLEVFDDGRGMTDEFVGRAFELFAQAEFGGGGLGLGLPLSRRLAEMHGGSLSGSSAGPGQGSRFVLRLPLRSAPRVAAPASAAMEIAPRRVLLVEDHADLAWSLEILLKRLGHEVHHAATGADALAVAPRFAPDLVLLDVGLPDADGADVARRLRETLGSRIVIAAMSGFGQQSVRQRCLDAGCNHFLTKPVQMEHLRALGER